MNGTLEVEDDQGVRMQNSVTSDRPKFGFWQGEPGAELFHGRVVGV